MEFRLTTPGVNLDRVTAQANKTLRAAQRKVGRDVAKIARGAILDDVKQSRGSLRFGTNRSSGRRYRLGAKSKVEPRGLSVDVTVTADPHGFWSIIEYGSRPHDIYPRKGRQGRNGRPAALLLYADFYAANVWHPGTTARPVWWAAEGALDRAVTPVIEDAYDEAFKEAAA